MKKTGTVSEYWKEPNIQSINDVINVAGHVIVIYFISEF